LPGAPGVNQDISYVINLMLIARKVAKFVVIFLFGEINIWRERGIK